MSHHPRSPPHVPLLFLHLSPSSWSPIPYHSPPPAFPHACGYLRKCSAYLGSPPQHSSIQTEVDCGITLLETKAMGEYARADASYSFPVLPRYLVMRLVSWSSLTCTPLPTESYPSGSRQSIRWRCICPRKSHSTFLACNSGTKTSHFRIKLEKMGSIR